MWFYTNCTVPRYPYTRILYVHIWFRIPVFRTFTDGLEPSSAEEKGEEEPCGGCVVAVITARSHTQSRKVWEATHTVEQGTTHTHTQQSTRYETQSRKVWTRSREISERKSIWTSLRNSFGRTWEISVNSTSWGCFGERRYEILLTKNLGR